MGLSPYSLNFLYRSLCAALNILAPCLLIVSGPSVLGQTTDLNQMDKLLDKVDQPGDWATPPNGNLPANPSPYPVAPGSQFAQPFLQRSSNQESNSPLFNRQTILKALFGGGPSTPADGSKNFKEIRNKVSYKLQTARDEASRAQSACDRASYGSDKYLRRQAAEQAQYAAQAANAAADAAYSLSGNTTSDISGLASQTRSEANRAQAAADRASANANGGGW
jgi:hypothetical protein